MRATDQATSFVAAAHAYTGDTACAAITLQGYRIITGQSRESMMALVVNAARSVCIITVATTMAFMGSDLHTLLTKDLDTSINQLFTGDDTTTVNNIDHNLIYTQAAMSVLDSIQVAPNDPEMQTSKTRAQLLAALGTAGPPMVAGAMLLLYQFAMALFIGVGPLFVLCLMFDQTKELFKRWLMYGIGTLFSMAALSAVCSIVLGLTLKVGAAYWASSVILGSSTEGLTNQAMQQGGIGLLMTVLIISVPPMAAMFFQGTMGSFMAYSQFNTGNRHGPQGQPPGAYSPALNYAAGQSSQGNQSSGSLGQTTINHATQTLGTQSPKSNDSIRPYNGQQ